MKKLFALVLVFCFTYAQSSARAKTKNTTTGTEVKTQTLADEDDFALLLNDQYTLIKKTKENISPVWIEKIKNGKGTQQESVVLLNKLGYKNFEEFKEARNILYKKLEDLKNKYSSIFADDSKLKIEIEKVYNAGKLDIKRDLNPCFALGWAIMAGCTYVYWNSGQTAADLYIWVLCMDSSYLIMDLCGPM